MPGRAYTLSYVKYRPSANVGVGGCRFPICTITHPAARNFHRQSAGFASDFDRPSDRVFDAGETGAVEVEVGAAPAARYSDAVLDGRRSGVRSIARIICRPRNRLDGLEIGK